MSELVDLKKLPAPKVVQELSYETLLTQRKEKFLSLQESDEMRQHWQARLQLESEPVVKLLEENAYLELLLRTNINESAKAVMLAYATGSDLDQLGALFGVTRLIIQAEDLKSNPPTTAKYEDDERFRTRIQMSLEGLTTAGSRASYEFHALSTSAKIKDVDVTSPTAGTVKVAILSTEGQGTADGDLIKAVKEQLNAEHIRPLTDTVLVESAVILTYEIQATITLYPSVLESVVMGNVNQAITSYVNKQHSLGIDITRSGIYAALHQEGVQNVKLTKPMDDLIVQPHQAAYCTQIQVNLGGRDE
ncbi:baseplate J/gp47 family protein [Haemophilus parainfluenzae]|jgi:baseplate J-like protein|uniref:baseplate assembly protein n=1 Tax=Haemophilus parainfluenzae TaxID=729 RepID=UPI00066CE94B|nr:baseplate J/gp47 family protein [Haemophilus parainfluenzae]MBE4951518.1 baseplate J/gp47 family protein [Haemophilus parainfluenzae]DAX33029.1 MAG TPA: baseplate assembly protein [Caudoviricetes sp.]